MFRSLLKPLKAHFDAAVQQMQEKFEALENLKQREEFEQLYDTDSAELGASLQSLERRSPRAHRTHAQARARAYAGAAFLSLFAVSLFTCRPTMTVTDWQADTGSLEQKWQTQVTSVGVKLAELEQRWRLRLACTRFWTQRRKPSAQVLAQRLALCTHAQVYA